MRGPRRIIDTQRRLAQAGRIRIGDSSPGPRGGKVPRKLATFRFTSTSARAIGQLAEVYGGTPGPWEDGPGRQFQVISQADLIEVLALPEEMGYSESMEHWAGGVCQRRCDGKFDVVRDSPCDCDEDSRVCKPHMRLSVILPRIDTVGLWRLDSVGWNALAEVGGAFELIEMAAAATGKSILPCTLRIDMRETRSPDPNDPERVLVRKFGVPVLELSAAAMQITAALPSAPALETPVGPVTPVPPEVLASGRNLREELASIDGAATAPRPQRSGGAQPVGPTGLDPRPLAAPSDGDTWEDGTPIDQSGSPGPTGAPAGQPAIAPGTVKPDEIMAPKATQRQIGMIHALLADVGLVDRDVQLGYYKTITGFEVATSKDLTKAQASKIIDQLTEDKKQLDREARDAAVAGAQE